jgi:hypothetical protein
MPRKVLVASFAIAAISAFLLASRPVEAGSCATLSEKAIGLKQFRDRGSSPKAIKPQSSSLGHEERSQEGRRPQAVDELQEEGRALSLHRGCQGVRQLIQSDLRSPVTQS